jgi:hypothetical protein
LHDTINRNKGVVLLVPSRQVLVHLFLGRDRFLLPVEMNSYMKTCRGLIYGIIAEFGRMGTEKLQIKSHSDSKNKITLQMDGYWSLKNSRLTTFNKHKIRSVFHECRLF